MKFYLSLKSLSWLLSLLVVLPAFVQCSRQTFSKPDGQSQYKSFAPDGTPFTVADSLWNVDSLGNHRAIVSVSNTSHRAVVVSLPWRRPDRHPATKRIVVIDNKTGRKLRNVHVLELTSEQGKIAFEPATLPGDYSIYYLPYKFREKWADARYGKPWNDYLDTTSYTLVDKEWVKNVIAYQSSLPAAGLRRFESRTEFDFFTPMGLIATQEEERLLREKHRDKPFILFPEDRAYPIRLPDGLPWRWIENGASDHFTGHASRNEYYTWQIGLWATSEDIANVKIQFSDFAKGSSLIPAGSFTCFNQEGINWDGTPVTFRVDVKKGNIQALWCGVQIPPDAAPGRYSGTATVTAQGRTPQKIRVDIHIDSRHIADKGDNELWRHSRLRWLNSTIGIDSLPVQPYEPMMLSGNNIGAGGKQVKLGKNGLAASIVVNDREILAQPIDFLVNTGRKTIPFRAENLEIEKTADGLVSWKSSFKEAGIQFICNAYMEFDGYIRYHIRLVPDEEISLEDVRLLSRYTREASGYFMGCGHKGGRTPDSYQWDWKGPWDSYWIGGYLSGLHVEFRGCSYHGPLLNDYKPKAPAAWANDGKGTITLERKQDHTAGLIASSGPRTLAGKDTLDFEFSFLITPVQPVDSRKHFSERYFHGDYDSFAKAAQEEANIANLHHSGVLNPIINYPFLIKDQLVRYIESQHAENRKVKLYYTIRELSNYTAEIFALKSLNHEIFVTGAGYGLPWHMEHLIDDYKPAWYTELPDQTSDAALVLNGFSRWINYYLEGLRWMYENYKIDGIYMDDVSFDRTVMKRMRKISSRYRPGALVDLHSNTAYSIGPMNQYTDFFPYVDRLWFGESFRYNEMSPDEWFVTFSGIPFGKMSEMLQDGGNRYLGMVYGATARHSWAEHSPAPVWKLWKSFGIGDARMIGYWSEDRVVETTHPDVKATAYVKGDQVLISVGNFDSSDRPVRLLINWEKLGLDASGYKLTAPEVDNFQEARSFSPGDEIPVKAKQGWLLILTPATH